MIIQSQLKTIFPIQRELIDWLMDSDPAIRWQVMDSLLEESPEKVLAERKKIPLQGWGRKLLDLHRPDGSWAGEAWNQGFDSTMHVLKLLRDIGLEPDNQEIQNLLQKTRQNVKWAGDPSFEGNPYFDGEVEACINGQVGSAAAYFGQNVEKLIQKFLGEAQKEDGGWNCDMDSNRGSFNSSFAVLDALWEYEHTFGKRPDISAARERGQEYFLERKLFKQKHSSGTIPYDRWVGPTLNMPAFTLLSFPYWWHYDILLGLDYFRKIDRYDSRLKESIEQLISKRNADGTWNLDIWYPGNYPVDFMEQAGQPSRWITLGALRVLKWVAKKERKPVN